MTAARNRAGRIGRSTLTVDKGRPETPVGVCRTGVTKTGPPPSGGGPATYVPDEDLRVLFVSSDAASGRPPGDQAPSLRRRCPSVRSRSALSLMKPAASRWS
nr:DUF4424 family protein [Methylobacterium nodulans]